MLGKEENQTGGPARSLEFTWGVLNSVWVFEKWVIFLILKPIIFECGFDLVCLAVKKSDNIKKNSGP